MEQDPAFLFYYRDFQHGTRRMTAEQKGIYIDLLCEQADARSGSISEDIMNDFKGQHSAETMAAVCGKFEKDEHGYYNERLRSVLTKRRKYCESRRNNRTAPNRAKEGKTKKHMLNICSTHVGHMGNGNENEIKLVNKIVNKDKDPKIAAEITAVIEHFNTVTGKAIKTTGRANRDHIRARLNEGFTVEDCKKVIQIKTDEWGQDPKMSKYLRIETLFGTKFEAYLNQEVIADPTGLGKYMRRD